MKRCQCRHQSHGEWGCSTMVNSHKTGRRCKSCIVLHPALR